MTKYCLLILALCSGMVLGSGCGDGSDEDSSSTDSLVAGSVDGDGQVDPAAPLAEGEVAPDAAAPALEDPAAEEVPAVEFTGITPTGIRQTSKFLIAGRTSVFEVACDPVEGATGYWFITGFQNKPSEIPSTTLQSIPSQFSESYEIRVTAVKFEGGTLHLTKAGVAILN